MMRGQIVVFENMIIFAISMVIFIFCFMIFLNLQDYYTVVSVHDQMNKVTNMVSAAIVAVATDHETNSSVVVKLPKTIGNEFYELRLYGATATSIYGNVTVKLKGTVKGSEVFGLGCCQSGMACLQGCYVFSGKALSQKGKVTVYKSGNQINIL